MGQMHLKKIIIKIYEKFRRMKSILQFDNVIQIVRSEYFAQTTIGELYLPGEQERFCWVLEDTVRSKGIKVKAETAIPATDNNLAYEIVVTYSGRFKRDMPLIRTNDYELKNNGISFSGIRLHGGNNHKNSEGCPLVAYNRPSEETIQGTAEKKLTLKIKELLEQGTVGLQIINKPQSK